VKGIQMESLIGKRVTVMWTGSSQRLKGTVVKVEKHMVFLTEVKNTLMNHEQSDQWINTRCETFQKFAIL